MHSSWQRVLAAPVFRLAAILCVLVGCKKDEIRVYTVPKERETALASNAAQGDGSPHIHYDTPAGWKEEQPGGIRVARFSVPAKQGPQIDVSVIPLPGITASKADVVNLWREQIRLSAIKEHELAGVTEKVKVGSDAAEMFDMVSDEAIIEDKHKARILVAMLSHGRTTWFFKMTGEDISVLEQKAAFMEFLASVQIDYSDHGSTRTDAPPTRPKWQVPETWKEVPPSQMLLAKFVVPDSQQPKAEVTVSVFPGDAGGLMPNINRWRQQLKLEPVKDDSLSQLATPLEVPGTKGVLVDMSGQNTNGQPSRIIGAILLAQNQTWFYKLTGDPQVAQQQKDAFVQFVQSAKYGNPH